MYSEEIDCFLRTRHFVINRDEYMELTPQKNPQISRLTYNTAENSFHLYTSDGYEWKFYVRNNE